MTLSTVNKQAIASTFYSDSELTAKTQKQLTAILNDELGQSIEPTQAKKIKNPGLIAMIIDLQSSVDKAIAVLEVETDNAIATATTEPATIEPATVEPTASEDEDPDRITDHDLSGLNAQLQAIGSVLSFKRYKSGVKLYSSQLNSTIKPFNSLEAAWVFVESQSDRVEAATQAETVPVAAVTQVKRGDVTLHINPIVETDDLVGRNMVAGLSAIAAKSEGKGTKKNNSSGKDAIFEPKTDEIKPVKAGSLNHQYFVDLLEGCTLDQLIAKYPSIANYTVNGKPDPKWCARDKAAYSTLLYGYRVQRVEGVYKIINATEILVSTPKVKEVKEPKVKTVKAAKQAIASVEPVVVVPRTTTQRKAINVTASTAKRNKRSKF